MDDSFAETPESIRRRANRFEIAMWFFLATMSLGLIYALFMGASFFPAFRQAAFQYAKLDQEGDFAAIVPFVNGVISTWPERLADFPATVEELVAILLAFILGMVAFRVVCKSPKGEPLFATHFHGEMLRPRVQRALELADSNVLLLKRTDDGEAAEYSKKKNEIYLPACFIQNLDRKFSDDVPKRLAFLIVHEKTHGSNSDNFLWSWGRSLAFLLTAISAMLIATPIGIAAAAAFPAKLAQILPFPISLGLTLLLSVVLLAFIGAVNHGVLPNFAAAREFFADTLAASTLTISPQSLPYKGTTDIASRGDMAAGWSMNTSGPDRLLHTKGIAPRTGALAASTLAMWMLIRTLMLMLDHLARYGMVWVFDAAYLIEIAVMLYNLPRRRNGVRDYGFLPWAATIALMGLISLSFALIGKVYSGYGIASIITPVWLAAIAVPALATTAALLYYRAAPVLQKGIEDIDRIPPRRLGMAPLIQLVAAVPSYVWSYTMAGLALFTWSETLASWGSGNFSVSQPYFMFNVASLPICASFVVLVVKNFREPRPLSAACEAGSGVIVFALLVYEIGGMILAAAMGPPGNSGPPFDMVLFNQPLISPPPHVVMATLIIATIFGAVLLASWEVRYRFLSHRSLFASLKHRPRRPVGQ